MEKEPGNINLSELMKIVNSTAGQELLSLVQNKKDEKGIIITLCIACLI